MQVGDIVICLFGDYKGMVFFVSVEEGDKLILVDPESEKSYLIDKNSEEDFAVIHEFKLQRSLNNNLVLCYNEDRSIMGEFPYDICLNEIFNETDLKVYVWGHYDVGGTLQILCKLDSEEFDW